MTNRFGISVLKRFFIWLPAAPQNKCFNAVILRMILLQNGY